MSPPSTPSCLRERLADLHKLLRLNDGVQPHVLGPVVEVLGEAVGGGRVRELLDLAERLAIVLEHPRGGVVERCRLLRAQGVLRERRLEGLVMLGEGTLGHVAPARRIAPPLPDS